MAPTNAPRTASLGELTFDLSPEELRSRAQRILASERKALDDLVAGGHPNTVDSLLAPLNRIVVAVRDVSSHGNLMFQVHPDEATRRVGREISEEAERFFNEFRTNERLFRRLEEMPLDASDDETRLAVKKLLREMRRAGVELPSSRREKILALMNTLDEMGNEFSGNISTSVRYVEVAGTSSLRGLPPDYLAAHTPGPDGNVRISTKYPDCIPVMNYAADSELRRRVLFEFMNVAYPQNLAVLQRLLLHRREFVDLLGYRTFADYAVEDKMTERTEVVADFLARVRELLRDPAQRDIQRFLARKRKDDPSSTQLEDWDGRFWPPGYYAMKIREEEYGLDPRELRSYLPYLAVRDGLFELCRELFGITFVRNREVALWNSDVEAYDVARDGEPLGRCYLDLTTRPGKFNHAAQFDVRTGIRSGGLPQGALVCNFLDGRSAPTEARLDYRDVVTFFHEFGHLLHALLSGHRRWVYNSMGYLEWDFIEAPSQLFEEWARDPATLSRFARNPDTGEAIPAALLARLRESEAVGRAAAFLRQVALATISLEIHRQDPRQFDGDVLCTEAFRTTAGIPFNTEYHPLASFGHLVGYSACYYTYLWSAVIARDLLTPFHEKGSLTDPRLARRYADEVLAPGGSRPAAELVRGFLGREFAFDAFERWVLAGAVPA